VFSLKQLCIPDVIYAIRNVDIDTAATSWQSLDRD
jgi:hypothetical protein